MESPSPATATTEIVTLQAKWHNPLGKVWQFSPSVIYHTTQLTNYKVFTEEKLKDGPQKTYTNDHSSFSSNGPKLQTA